MWITQLPNDGDVYTSLLTIKKAILLDAGQYTCQVTDWGVQQCKSIYIEVRDDPDVKVIPMSATIEKVSLSRENISERTRMNKRLLYAG